MPLRFGPELAQSVRLGYGRPLNPLTALLWPTGTEAGMWLDPSDASTAYQDSAGTTAGVLDQPVGLRLDNRFGSVRGAQNLADPGFDDASKWTTNATWSVAGGVLTLTNCLNTAGPIGNTAVAIVAGMSYEVIVVVSEVTLGGLRAGVGGSLSPGFMVTPGTYRYVIVAGATSAPQIAANGTSSGVVTSFSVRAIPGNHFLQATATARPVWKQASGIDSDQFDGADDGYGTATFPAGTLTNNMDCFIAVKRNADVGGAPVWGHDSTRHFGSWGASATANSAANAVGTPTFYVDGVQVVSGSQADLATALGTGAWRIEEIRSLDLSAWTLARISGYTGFMMNASIGGLILCPAQSDATRAIVRRELGRKVGLSL